MKKKRLPRKLKKRMRNDISGFTAAFPAFFMESIRAAVALSHLMRTFPTYPCVKEYIRHHIVAGQKINDDLKVGGVVFTEGEFIVPDRFKNQTVLPVIERLKQSSLMNDDLKRTTDLLRGSFGVVQPNVIRVNESI
jgi:hypothetical protein